MTRLRWTLALLGLGIAIPTAAIVQRALVSLELENEVGHEAVAERVFDEMERALSDWLGREEARPPEQYDVARELWERNQASFFDDSDEPFVLGRFVLEASGGSSVVLARAAQAQRIEAALAETWGRRAPSEKEDRRAEEADRFSPQAAMAPAPGRTHSIGKRSADRPEPESELDEAESASSAYEVLQSLNRAQRKRADRKLAKSSSEPIPEPSSAPALRAEGLAGALSSLDLLDSDDAERGAGDAQQDPVRRLVLAAASVDPLIGRATARGEFVLARSVWRRGSVERQGLVLDRQALIVWLEQRVLAETGLGDRARLGFGAQPEGLPTHAAHRYLHRFAEPFDGLLLRLDLEPLPGFGNARPLYTLAALLAFVAILGLYAVGRMTGVVVDYAERRSNFVAAVSHELKTPLTSIRMYGEMLRDGLVSSESKRDEYYATIVDESERLSRLIENVLEFSRLENTGRELNLRVGDLSEAIREACDKLRTHIEREGFAFQIEIEEDLPAVEYDPDAVTQLVFNLVDNAVKYARHAEPRKIEIELGRLGQRVELRVRDFGPGVPERDLQRVFEPFYRVGEELTRTTSGTGIGLALVKQLAEGMGARVCGRNLDGGGFEVAVAFGPG